MLFKTAKSFLDKAEEIVNRHYEKNSYDFLDF